MYVKGHFTEDRVEWRKELQSHCEELCTHQEETKVVQERRTEYCEKRGNQQFTEDGRGLQARAKLSDNKVNGPEDAIVSEMIKKFLLEKICTIARCFQEGFMGLMESPRPRRS